jgi:hypothetical protein
MQNSLRLILFVVSGYFLYRNRYRVMNKILEQPSLRRLAVAISMQMPFFRHRILRQML